MMSMRAPQALSRTRLRDMGPSRAALVGVALRRPGVDTAEDGVEVRRTGVVRRMGVESIVLPRCHLGVLGCLFFCQRAQGSLKLLCSN